MWSRFALWLFDVDLVRYPTSAPVAELYRRRLAGAEPGVMEWRDAAAAAARGLAWKRFAGKPLELLRAAQ